MTIYYRGIFNSGLYDLWLHYVDSEVDHLKYLSVAIYNRELIVINDMDMFAHYYCYAKKQKPGLAAINKTILETEEGSDELVPVIEYENVEPVVQDDDIL